MSILEFPSLNLKVLKRIASWESTQVMASHSIVSKKTNIKLADAKLPLPLWELVAIIASLMALNAAAIDIMLPALGDVAETFALDNSNDQQLVIFAFLLGFGVRQLVFGPFSDRFGRRGLLLICLVFYTATSFACMGVSSFSVLLAFRFVQGMFSAGIRSIATSIVRDLIAGRAMAKVMSLVMTVFMIVPIIAPAIGQTLMLFASWQWTFGICGILGFIMFVWTYFRMPETLAIEDRRDLSFESIKTAFGSVLKNRVSFGYMLASGFMFGALFAFIGASEQVFEDIFHRGDQFAIWFAVIAISLACATFSNAKLVEQYGMRRISHLVLLVFSTLMCLNFLLMFFIGEIFFIFLPLFALAFGCFGMIGSNFSAIALEPQGKFAGTASAVYGFITSTLSVLIGFLIARRFDGTINSILIGFVVLGVLSIIVVLVTEKGRLFEIGEGYKE